MPSRDARNSGQNQNPCWPIFKAFRHPFLFRKNSHCLSSYNSTYNHYLVYSGVHPSSAPSRPKAEMKLRIIFLIISFCSILSLTIPSFAQNEEDCFTCHEETFRQKLNSSIHGEIGISCLDCHQDLRGIKEFPHPEKLQPVTCETCHSDVIKEWSRSIHGRAESMSLGVVKCSDCHGDHDVRPKGDPQSMVYPLNLPKTCERCHLEAVKNASRF